MHMIQTFRWSLTSFV